MNPIEAINQEAITVSLTGKETELLMELIDLCSELGIFDKNKRVVALTILDKFEFAVEEKATKQMHILRNGLN